MLKVKRPLPTATRVYRPLTDEEKAKAAAEENARLAAIADSYFSQAPSVLNLARGTYAWAKSLPWLLGGNENPESYNDGSQEVGLISLVSPAKALGAAKKGLAAARTRLGKLFTRKPAAATTSTAEGAARTATRKAEREAEREASERIARAAESSSRGTASRAAGTAEGAATLGTAASGAEAAAGEAASATQGAATEGATAAEGATSATSKKRSLPVRVGKAMWEHPWKTAAFGAAAYELGNNFLVKDIAGKAYKFGTDFLDWNRTGKWGGTTPQDTVVLNPTLNIGEANSDTIQATALNNTPLIVENDSTWSLK